MTRRVAVSGSVLAGFTALAVLCTLSVWVSPLARLPGEPGVGAFDPYNSAWWLNWTPFAVTHGLNPFTSNYLNYPTGMNMMWNNGMPVLGVLLWPITATGGAVLTDNVITTASFALSAFFAYFAIRRYIPARFAALVGGLIYGFSPYMFAQGAVHAQQIAYAMTIPLAFLLVDEALIRQRMRPWLLGLLIAALGIVQFFILEEYFLTELIAAAVLTLILALSRRDQIRLRLPYAVRAVGTAAIVVGAALAYPVVAVQLHGPARVVGNVRDPQVWVTDLLNLVVPTSTQLVAPHWATAVTQHFSGNLAEWDGYLGIGLLAVAAGTIARCWRQPVVRAAGVFAGLMTLLSLGPYLHVGGTQLPIPLPWWIPAHMRYIDNIQPNRLMVFAFLGLAFVVAFALSVAWRQRHGLMRAGVMAGLVVVPLTPQLPLPWQQVSVPAYFTSAAVREIPKNAVVYTVPCPCGYLPDALAWQMASGMRFKLIGAANAPGASAVGQDYLAEISLTLASHGRSFPPLSEAQRAAIVAEMRASHVSAVVLGPTPSPTAVADLTTLLGAAPEVQHGVDVWVLTPT